MKGYILSILGMLFCVQIAVAQNENTNLLVQSTDGKTVKLVWFFKSWSNDLKGVDIKRKEGLQNWVKLNDKPIVPGITVKKSLAGVEADATEERRIKSKMFKLIQSGRIAEMDDSIMLRKLRADDGATRALQTMMSHDFDVALMSGFAYVDHTVTNKTNYEYGVFITGSDILLDSVQWNYGQIPDLSAVTDITSKSVTGRNGIQLTWNADMGKMRQGDIAGFNIYREGIRLNQEPVMATGKDNAEFTWFDKSANSAALTQYSISAESIFGIEGIIKSYTYNPANHPAVYKVAEVNEIGSLGYYFKEGISVKWVFPAEYERYIKGFYVMKDNIPGGYKQVSPLLEPSSRWFTDKSESPVTSYIRFKVVTVYHDRTEAPGVEKVYSYFPVREPPQPQNVRITGEAGNKKYTVHLSWDKQMNGDSLTDYYRVCMYNPAEEKFTPVSEQPLRTNTFTYVISDGSAAVHKFTVISVAKSKIESTPSDTVSVAVQSIDLPLPVISGAAPGNGKAVVRWQYADVSDLRGFRLFQNKEQIAGESELRKNSREFAASNLIPGQTYEYMIQAVSEHDVLSEVSLPVTVTIPLQGKKP